MQFDFGYAVWSTFCDYIFLLHHRYKNNNNNIQTHQPSARAFCYYILLGFPLLAALVREVSQRVYVCCCIFFLSTLKLPHHATVSHTLHLPMRQLTPRLADMPKFVTPSSPLLCHRRMQLYPAFSGGHGCPLTHGCLQMSSQKSIFKFISILCYYPFFAISLITSIFHFLIFFFFFLFFLFWL